MHFLKTWTVTTILFFIGDIVWLYCVMNRFFVPHIKHLMNSSNNGIVINYLSALLAYMLISSALSIFVVVTHMQDSLSSIFVHGAFLGLCLYGVYELTNYAILHNWPLSFLIVDIVWGTLWCGIVSLASVALIRYFK